MWWQRILSYAERKRLLRKPINFSIILMRYQLFMQTCVSPLVIETRILSRKRQKKRAKENRVNGNPQNIIKAKPFSHLGSVIQQT